MYQWNLDILSTQEFSSWIHLKKSLKKLGVRARSSHQRCSVKKGVLRNFTKFTGKQLCLSLFFNKVAGLRPASLFKKRLRHRCFPVNFAKFLRAPFYRTMFEESWIKENPDKCHQPLQGKVDFIDNINGNKIFYTTLEKFLRIKFDQYFFRLWQITSNKQLSST